MERIKKLNCYKKCILILMIVMSLVFAVIYQLDGSGDYGIGSIYYGITVTYIGGKIEGVIMEATLVMTALPPF